MEMKVQNSAYTFGANQTETALPQQKTEQSKEIEDFDAKLKAETPESDVAVLNKQKADEMGEDKSELSKEEKQEILKKATAKAAGWAVLFGIFDTAYYGLRRDKTVAKRFDLDVEKDKNFIKQIKKEQVKATLPSVIGTVLGNIVAASATRKGKANISTLAAVNILGWGPRLGGYAYHKTKDSSKLEVRKN